MRRGAPAGSAGTIGADLVLGNGPRDLVLVPGIVSNLELAWERPPRVEFLTGIRCRDNPNGPAADDRAVGLLPGSVVVPEGLGDLAPAALAVLAVQAD